jgi:hypothetical protein
MNDPTFLEAARVLAQRDLHEAGPSETDRIRYAFRLATNRDPAPQEFTILDRLYRKQRAHYDAAHEEAAKVIQIGESTPDKTFDPVDLASWTLVTSTILNMDETITKN